MREFKRDRGFLVFAQQSSTDYVRLAYALALSLKVSQKTAPYLSIAITPGTTVEERYRWAFDEIIEIPWGDDAGASQWKLENEWKAFHLTPYRETVKLDADMLFGTDISHWWDIMAKAPLGFSSRVYTHRGDVATGDPYRKVFTANHLPNVYSAMSYFRQDETCLAFFDLAEIIFKNWSEFFLRFLPEENPRLVSTDVVFGLAAKIMEIPLDHMVDIGFVHMKTRLLDLPPEASEEWARHLDFEVTPSGAITIGRYRQTRPVHYSDKTVLTDIHIERLEALCRG